jgi:hypothetical protein
MATKPSHFEKKLCASGERMWKSLSKLEQKEKDMLDARLKKSTAKPAPPAAAAARGQTPDASSQMRKSTNDIASVAVPAAAPKAEQVAADAAVRASMPAYSMPAELLGKVS